jgi:5'-methylthioadenosine phosphorylase
VEFAGTADIAVIGGSGLYALLTNATELTVDTPYGQPSDAITIATVGGRRVAFLPRHGRDHRYPPHRIPYRANMWALHHLGVRQILAPCAVGGLRAELGPGTFVVPDQLLDRTSARAQTFYDDGAVHVNFADPYCPNGRRTLLESAGRHEIAATDGGTMVVIEGPRFSTRAESRAYTAMGGAVINMTGHPEAVLARELAVCYAAMALVTDLDAGVEGDHGVTQEEVFRVFGENTDRLRVMLLDAVAALPTERDCACAHALDGLTAAEAQPAPAPPPAPKPASTTSAPAAVTGP